jgi:hypothetical protein
MVISYFDSSFHTNHDQKWGLSVWTIRRYTGKNYGARSSATLGTMIEIVKSLNAGYPVIVYTNAYGQHIFVLTGYDWNRSVFYANNPSTKTCHKDVNSVAGKKLEVNTVLSMLQKRPPSYRNAAILVGVPMKVKG